MKKYFAILVLVAAISSPAFAQSYSTNTGSQEVQVPVTPSSEQVCPAVPKTPMINAPVKTGGAAPVQKHKIKKQTIKKKHHSRYYRHRINPKSGIYYKGSKYYRGSRYY